MLFFETFYKTSIQHFSLLMYNSTIKLCFKNCAMACRIFQVFIFCWYLTLKPRYKTLKSKIPTSENYWNPQNACKYKEKNCHISVVLKGVLIIQKNSNSLHNHTNIMACWNRLYLRYNWGFKTVALPFMYLRYFESLPSWFGFSMNALDSLFSKPSKAHTLLLQKWP